MDRQSDILLESGTNELGVMEFTIGGEVFGINVAMDCHIKNPEKILEILDDFSPLAEQKQIR